MSGVGPVVARPREEAGESVPARSTGRLDCYVPRVLLERLAATPDAAVVTEDGTMVFVDISGFTKLSERLSRAGREGSEHLADTISACFSTLLAQAYAAGGSLHKFGGDALLLWFVGDEHVQRACGSAVAMRATLRQIGRVRAGASTIVLRMSVGVHSGAYDAYLLGHSHREYIVAGPAASAVVALESSASTGQILVSEQTAARLPQRCVGAPSGPGFLLARAPAVTPWLLGESGLTVTDEEVAACLSTAVRAHLLSAPAHPEHRTASIAFLQLGELDRLVGDEGPQAGAAAIEEVVEAAQQAADRYEICFLGSDIAGDGCKLLFCAGAPRVVGDDEQRILYAMRQIVDSRTRLPVRAGVNRGHVFCGEVGPPYRRTYTLMGDAVNLAARLMAKSPWRAIYASESVIERTRRRFGQAAVPPFMVKGKSRPVTAVEVGAAIRAAPVDAAGTPDRLPLFGRERELEAIGAAIAAARGGRGAMIELLGKSGSGTSRLLSEAREPAVELRVLHTVCDSYTRAVPFIVWRDLLRQLLGLGWDDPDALVLERLRERVSDGHRDLEPWLPLLAIATGVEAPTTREVDELAADARMPKLHEVVLSLFAPELAVPTLVLIEQLDLMDEASAALLAALARELPHSSWLVLGNRRDAHGGFVAEGPAVTRLELGPLSRADALALAEATPVAERLPPHTISLAVERSAGNPEFLLALLAAAAGGSGELPDTIESAASATIDALDPSDRTLVRRAAVLGEYFRGARLRHVIDGAAASPEQETWSRLHGIIESDVDGYLRFASPILCEVAYAGLPFGLRRALHAAVGDALEADLGVDVDAEPAVLATHFGRAGDHDRAWRYALMGAERACAHFAVADAVRLYRQAIDAHRGASVSAPELAAVWEALGEALMTVGETSAADRALRSASRLYGGEPIAEARICFRRGQIAEASELSNAVRWMHRGLRVLEGGPEPQTQGWRARLIAELGWIRQRQRRYHDAEQLCREAFAAGEAAGELRAQARAAYTLDWALFELGRFEDATYSARALEIYRELGDPEQEGRVLNNLGGLAYWRGRWQDAIDLYRKAGACSERAGHAADLAFTDANIGEILADQGRLDDAARHLRRAQRVWSATGHRSGTAFANMMLGRVAVRAGRTDEGLLLLHQAFADMERFRVDFYADLAQALIVEGEALGGDAERALTVADERLAAGSSYVSLLRRARGIALGRLGERDVAVGELRLAEAAARERGEDFDVALALDALAVLGAADTPALVERDAILERLGIVAVASVAASMPTDAGGEPLAAGAASGSAGLSS